MTAVSSSNFSPKGPGSKQFPILTIGVNDLAFFGHHTEAVAITIKGDTQICAYFDDFFL